MPGTGLLGAAGDYTTPAGLTPPDASHLLIARQDAQRAYARVEIALARRFDYEPHAGATRMARH